MMLYIVYIIYTSKYILGGIRCPGALSSCLPCLLVKSAPGDQRTWNETNDYITVYLFPDFLESRQAL